MHFYFYNQFDSYLNKEIEKRTNKANDTDKKTNKINTKISKAIRIYRTAELCNGQLIQIINKSNFGRVYYKGVNLQSVDKEIRVIALGDCIEYGIDTLCSKSSESVATALLSP